MSGVRQHLRDRPLEFWRGVAFMVAGVLVLAAAVRSGTGDFVPDFLRDAPLVVVALYSALAVAAGALIVAGLQWQAARDAVLGRWMEAVGHLFVVAICLTYSVDLVVTDGTDLLVLTFLLANVAGGTVRAVVLLRQNWALQRALRFLAAGDGERG